MLRITDALLSATAQQMQWEWRNNKQHSVNVPSQGLRGRPTVVHVGRKGERLLCLTLKQGERQGAIWGRQTRQQTGKHNTLPTGAATHWVSVPALVIRQAWQPDTPAPLQLQGSLRSFWPLRYMTEPRHSVLLTHEPSTRKRVSSHAVHVVPSACARSRE